MTASSSVRVMLAAGDDRAGVRAVRDAARVQRERRLLDAAAAAELAADVVQHLVGLHVRVGVRHLDRVGMRVEQPRGERADHEPAGVSNVWWIGGGWWTVPVIGSKSSALNVYG